MVRDRIDIGLGDSVALCVGRDLIYLRDKPVHELAAYVYEPLDGVELYSLALGRKTADYPFYKYITALSRDAYLFAVFLNGLIQLKAFIRLKADGRHENDRAVIGYIGENAAYLICILKLIYIDSAHLNKAAF